MLLPRSMESKPRLQKGSKTLFGSKELQVWNLVKQTAQRHLPQSNIQPIKFIIHATGPKLGQKSPIHIANTVIPQGQSQNGRFHLFNRAAMAWARGDRCKVDGRMRTTINCINPLPIIFIKESWRSVAEPRRDISRCQSTITISLINRRILGHGLQCRETEDQIAVSCKAMDLLDQSWGFFWRKRNFRCRFQTLGTWIPLQVIPAIGENQHLLGLKGLNQFVVGWFES